MHHPITILLLALVLFLVLSRGGKSQTRNGCSQAKKPLSTDRPNQATVPPANQQNGQPKIQSEAAEDNKFSQDEAEQLRQALSLSTDIKKLESDFMSISGRLPEAAQDAPDEARSSARKRECTIITEQLRIAKSYANELMRFAMAPYQATPDAQHTPSFNDASWAFTAAHLTLRFARARVIGLC
jgi:hypothetical protein